MHSNDLAQNNLFVYTYFFFPQSREEDSEVSIKVAVCEYVRSYKLYQNKKELLWQFTIVQIDY